MPQSPLLSVLPHRSASQWQRAAEAAREEVASLTSALKDARCEAAVARAQAEQRTGEVGAARAETERLRRALLDTELDLQRAAGERKATEQAAQVRKATWHPAIICVLPLSPCILEAEG